MTDFAPEKIKAPRLFYLDGLRGCAALIVAFHHFICFYDFDFISGDKKNPSRFEHWFASTPLNIFYAGNTMVQIFFVLSGYVLIRSFSENQSVLAALGRRYVRLTLPIFFTITVAWILNHSGLNFFVEIENLTHTPWLGGGAYQPAQSNFLAIFTQPFYRILFEPWDIKWTLDQALWTMPIEFSGSVILIIIAFLWKNLAGPEKKGLQLDVFYAILIAVSIFCWGYYQFFIICGAWLFLLDDRKILPQKIPNLLSFFMGIIALVFATYPYSKLNFIYKFISFSPKFFINYSKSLRVFLHWEIQSFYHGIAALLILFLVLRLSFLQSFFRRFLFLGKISFPLFLIHSPVLFMVSGLIVLLGNQLNFISLSLVFISYFTIAIGVSWLMYLYIEKPSVRFSKRVGAYIDRWLSPPVI